MPIATPEEVIAHWTETLSPADWYRVDPAIDDALRARFAPTCEAARAGDLLPWLVTARGALAYLLVTDQFPRNIYRGDARSFATDDRAVAAARRSLIHGLDMAIPEPVRQFFYLPFMHAESAEHQERGLRLILTRMPRTGAANLLHARAHREVIRRFGRFPYRNAVLGRQSTAGEQAFLDQGGYGAVVRALEPA